MKLSLEFIFYFSACAAVELLLDLSSSGFKLQSVGTGDLKF